MCSVCVGAGTGDVTAMIRDPQGRQNSVEVMMEDKGDSTYHLTYRPTQAGSHVVTVTFGGVGIPKSPFNVDVGPGELSLCGIVRLLAGHLKAVFTITPLLPGLGSLYAWSMQGDGPWSAAVGDEGKTERGLQGGHQKCRQRGPEGARQGTQ